MTLLIKKLNFATKQIKERSNTIVLPRHEKTSLTGSLGGRRLDECEADEDAVAAAAAGAGGGAVHLRLVQPRLGAMRRARSCSQEEGENHGNKTRSHGSLPPPSPLLGCLGLSLLWGGVSTAGEETDLGWEGSDGGGRRAASSRRGQREEKELIRGGAETSAAQLAGNGDSVVLDRTCNAACGGPVRRYRCEEVKHLSRILE